jgi:5'-nucleotidase
MAMERWQKAAASVLHSSRSRRHFRDRIHITSKEHMTVVDCFDGARQRAGEPQGESNAIKNPSEEDLLVVYPSVDGRLKDEAQG